MLTKQAGIFKASFVFLLFFGTFVSGLLTRVASTLVAGVASDVGTNDAFWVPSPTCDK